MHGDNQKDDIVLCSTALMQRKTLIYAVGKHGTFSYELDWL